jgi:hypothetical protein
MGKSDCTIGIELCQMFDVDVMIYIKEKIDFQKNGKKVNQEAAGENIKQNVDDRDNEILLLKQEVKFLKEKNALLENQLDWMKRFYDNVSK